MEFPWVSNMAVSLTTAIWGFFASTAVTCFFSWLAAVTQPNPLADWYLAGAIFFGIASILVLFSPLLKKTRLEPIHVILIGLLVAAAGVGWQWQRSSRAIASGPAVKAAPAAHTDFIKNQNVERVSTGASGVQPALLYSGRIASTGDHLRIYLEYYQKEAAHISPNRMMIGELRNYVKNDEVSIPVMTRNDDGNGKYLFVWGPTFVGNPLPIGAEWKARILVLGDDGTEQHYYFLVTNGVVNGSVSYPSVTNQANLKFVEEWEAQ